MPSTLALGSALLLNQAGDLRNPTTEHERRKAKKEVSRPLIQIVQNVCKGISRFGGAPNESITLSFFRLRLISRIIVIWESVDDKPVYQDSCASGAYGLVFLSLCNLSVKCNDTASLKGSPLG